MVLGSFVLVPPVRAANPGLQTSETQIGDSKEREVTDLGAGGSCVGCQMTFAARNACRGLAERDVFCQPLGESRRQLHPGVGYYTLQVKVGAGEHDVITLHRVVAEYNPGRPKPAPKALFMIHGDLRGFEAAFFGLTLYNDPPQESMPVFMARHAVDVWGISYRWAQVPVGFPDQSFMEGWGMDTAVSDARIGLRIARVARWLGGQGHKRLHVVGFSRGVWAAMALANAEATEPPIRRDVGGLIPIDGSYKGDPANQAWREGNCSDYAWYQDLLAAGTFGEDTSFLPLVGQLALDAPNEPSPFVPGLTNRQFAIGVGIWAQEWPGVEWFHSAAGKFDGDIPTGMVYIDPRLFFVELTKVFGFNPVLYRSDAASVTCDELDVPWDDHLPEVRVPLFYVGAAGGFGTVGEYLTEIVGSQDVSSLIVRERPPEEATLDVGHNDLFLSGEARELFWEPILAWIRAH
jgi:hypothetical protein